MFNFRCLNSNSPNNLQLFLEKFDSNVSVLKRINIVKLDDYILTYLAMTKLSSETISVFELVREPVDILKYEELVTFIKSRSKLVYTSENPRSIQNMNSYYTNKSNESFATNNSESHYNKSCLFCKKGSHLLKYCNSFKSSNFDTKFKFIKDNRLCLNCFSSKHIVIDCSIQVSMFEV